MDYKLELDEIQNKVETNKTEKIKLEERLKHLKEEKVQVLTELKELGLEEDKLNDTILDLEVDIQNQITECQEVLNES